MYLTKLPFRYFVNLRSRVYSGSSVRYVVAVSLVLNVDVNCVCFNFILTILCQFVVWKKI